MTQKPANGLFNLTDVPSTAQSHTLQNGEIVKYILNYNTTTKSGWLALWNWTSANGVPAATALPVFKADPTSGSSYYNSDQSAKSSTQAQHTHGT